MTQPPAVPPVPLPGALPVAAPTPLLPGRAGAASAGPLAFLRQLLALWAAGDHAGTARRLRRPLHARRRQRLADVRAQCPGRLVAYDLRAARDTAAAVTVVTAWLFLEDGPDGHGARAELWRFRLLCLDAAHRPQARTAPGGRWTVQHVSVLPEVVPRALRA
ncbi:hypothetical protein [Deinococcus petrolearius]|uniref:SnoaL-like domain-containing protein n=1 Tax=Deinococcus petrolearius TaxID=1751295 RepID=A0ABW1DIU8_9DEIO